MGAGLGADMVFERLSVKKTTTDEVTAARRGFLSLSWRKSIEP
jgi:hypothetical protein